MPESLIPPLENASSLKGNNAILKSERLPEPHPFQGNHLLESLSLSGLQNLTSHLQPLLFHTGEVLFQQNSPCEVVYFPKVGSLSLMLTSREGTDVEVGFVGPEGAIGVMDALTHSPNSSRGQVQMAGTGWRLPSTVLREEFERNSELQSVLLRHQRALGVVAAQNVLCNRLHSIEQRLAKWLLRAQDRLTDNQELELTHEFIAAMLGSRRAPVTLAAQSLREAGLIDYKRGLVTILDRPGLEDVACECYAVLRAQFKPVD